MAREQRRLAAILAADVVGYSRLMGRDESGTVVRLRDVRVGCLEPALVRHGGRLVKLTGDGALVEFASAVDALSAAIEAQQATANANHAQPEDTAIVFRMGLHLGDVIVEGDDLYGDAVNVAYRLEAEAQSGGIVVSDAVRDAVGGRLKATFVDRGSLTLKNIERPIHAFGVNWEPSDWPVPETPAGRASPKRLILWAAAAVSVVILAVVSYRIYAPQPATTMVELKDLKADDLEHLLAERRSTDAAMAEKKRLEEEARARAEAESATAQQAEAALKKAREDRQKAEADLAKLKAQIAARQPKLTDRTAGQAAEEEAQHEAEAEMVTLRQVEDEAQRKAISDAKNKRKADEALALAQSERQKAEAEARAKADAALASGFVVLPSNYPVSVTVERLEHAIRSVPADTGLTLQTRHIDLAAEAEKIGVRSLPRTVVELREPYIGAMNMKAAPTFAMEGPDRFVVWQDHEGKVWLAHKSAEGLQKTYARHGMAIPKASIEAYGRFFDELAMKATQ